MREGEKNPNPLNPKPLNPKPLNPLTPKPLNPDPEALGMSEVGGLPAPLQRGSAPVFRASSAVLSWNLLKAGGIKGGLGYDVVASYRV